MSNLETLEPVKTGVNAKNRVNIEVKIATADLPLSCPLPNMTLWDMHPKVYLALNHEQQAKCPYCGTNYELTHD